MIELALDALFKRRDIMQNVAGSDRLFMTRWFLGFAPTDDPGEWRTNWFTRLMKRWLAPERNHHAYLHRMVMSDSDSDPHDHMWEFWTRVLWRSYDDHEDRLLAAAVDSDGWPVGLVRGEPSVDRLRLMSGRHRPAHHTHWVRLRDGKPAWTLVVRGPVVRDWGFRLGDGSWVPWREYLRFDGPDPYDPPEQT
jgi:hypothetical protein